MNLSMEGLRANKWLRRLLLLILQAGVILTALLAAMALRFDGSVPAIYRENLPHWLMALVTIKLLIFWRLGLFEGWWQYVSLPDLGTLLKANLLASGCFVAFGLTMARGPGLGRSVYFLDGLLCFLLLASARVVTRIARESFGQYWKQGQGRPQRILVVGAGAAGQTVVRELRQNPRLNMTVLGFLDNDPDRQDLRFQGVPVLGGTADLERICRQQQVELVIVTQCAVCRRELQTILEVCRRDNISFKILPTVGEIINGNVSIRHIRDVSLDDLLGRRPVNLDVGGIEKYLRGSRVLITGAAGSIGSEICRQVARFGAGEIILLDHAETGLFNIERELRGRFPTTSLVTCLGDVRDGGKILQLLARLRPEVVFHAAAYKHVPMLEFQPIEAVRNNALGTRNVAEAAHLSGAGHFVMISTDKAVNPSSVMGATKRAAEVYVQYLAAQSRTNFITVRFGNVLGSNGSVIPLFREQIEKGGPVTVTHPEVTRFFMTIPEAAQLVLQAGSMGKGGEIFLLDMGEPIRIVQLAEQLIRLSGLRPYEDIDIVFSGLRPGEKLHEELFLTGEGLQTGHRKIFVARANGGPAADIAGKFDEIARHVQNMNVASVLAGLRAIVPEFCAAADEVAATGELPAGFFRRPAGSLAGGGKQGVSYVRNRRIPGEARSLADTARGA